MDTLTQDPNMASGRPQPPAEPLVLPEGVRLHYELLGQADAPRLLVLCPSSAPLTDVWPLIAGRGAASAFDAHFRCLSLDYRGIGESSKSGEPSVAPWPAPSIHVFVDDVLALLHHVGWNRCHVIGLSFGAAVAQELLLRRPSDVSFGRVLMVCPTCDIRDHASAEGAYPLHELLSLGADERSEQTLLLADTRRDSEWLESRIGQAAMYYMRQAENAIATKPGALEGRRFQLLARSRHAIYDRLRAATGEAAPPADTTGLLAGQSGAPPLCESVLIFASVFDAIAPPATARRLQASIKGSGLLWFSTGHWPVLPRECAADFGSAAVAFLAGKPLPSSVLQAAALAEEQIPKPAADAGTSWLCDGSCVLL